MEKLSDICSRVSFIEVFISWVIYIINQDDRDIGMQPGYAFVSGLNAFFYLLRLWVGSGVIIRDDFGICFGI